MELSPLYLGITHLYQALKRLLNLSTIAQRDASKSMIRSLKER